MSARIAAIATHLGPDRNEQGAAVDPGRDELDMAIKVAREVVEDPSQEGAHFDMVIFATSGIRHVFPSGAAAIANELGMTCEVYDITAGCASMGIAMQLGDRASSTSLVVCADVLSRTIDPADPSHAPLRSFADGAAAVVIRHDVGSGPKILAYRSKTCGRWRQFYGSTNGRLIRSLPSECKKELGTVYLQSWTELGRELLALCPEGSDPWVYASQGDPALFPQLAAELGIRNDRLVRTGHGHAGGADPWIGLQLQPPPAGSPMLCLASGIGFTFHGMLLEMG